MIKEKAYLLCKVWRYVLWIDIDTHAEQEATRNEPTIAHELFQAGFAEEIWERIESASTEGSGEGWGGVSLIHLLTKGVQFAPSSEIRAKISRSKSGLGKESRVNTTEPPDSSQHWDKKRLLMGRLNSWTYSVTVGQRISNSTLRNRRRVQSRHALVKTSRDYFLSY